MGIQYSRSFFEGTTPTSEEVPNTATDRNGAARTTSAKSLHRPHMTLYTNLMDRRRVDDGSRPIFGWRPIDPKTGTAGDYEWITYSAFLDQVDAVAAGMVHALQLRRQEPVGVFAKNRYEWVLVEHGCNRMAYQLPVGVFAKNRYEWVLVEHGCNRMAYQLVPLYDTLGPTAVPFILNQTEMRVIFVAKAQWPILADAIKHSPSVKHVVQFEDVSEEQRKEAAALNVALTSLKDLVAAGEKKPVAADPPTPDDICTICYTSGTTGDPKGAMILHRNLMSAVMAAIGQIDVTAEDRHLSYLPLAHILERAMHAALISAGASIGFYQGNVLQLLDDLAALQPTIFPSVPRVLNRVYDKITQGVEKAGGLKKMLFNSAYQAKLAGLADGFVHHAFWDALVFNKVRQVLGGRVRLILTGAAPISLECKQLLQIVFCCPVLEAYGMTETCAATVMCRPQCALGRNVGLPLPNVEVCLFDVPEMNYTQHDSPCPRGEVCVRGDPVFKGYYKDPERTAEAIDADGWLHTGDIGQWNPDGTLC
ncbi:hypothetical protein ATCC90586_004257 [Pythium insidiosum]|nr:hypothetical protein ATCC90586_004257 [Pythium insidiosum]